MKVRMRMVVAVAALSAIVLVAGCVNGPTDRPGSGSAGGKTGGSGGTSSGKMKPGSARLLDADSGKSVELAVGGTLVVDLEENATTGFTWVVWQPLPSVIATAGDTFNPPSDTGVVGAAGRRILSYDVKSAGEGDLTVAYMRPWEGTDVAAAKTFTVHLVVK